MHDVTLVYTEYNHRLEVWVLGKRAANTTADRQQYTNTSKVCDDTMSMGGTYPVIEETVLDTVVRLSMCVLR